MLIHVHIPRALNVHFIALLFVCTMNVVYIFVLMS